IFLKINFIPVRAPVYNPLFTAILLQIPLHRFGQKQVEILRRLPSKFPLYFRRVHSIAVVVSGTVRDERDQIFIISVWPLSFLAVHYLTDMLYQFNVFPLIVAPDIILFACSAFIKDCDKCFTMVDRMSTRLTFSHVA